MPQIRVPGIIYTLVTAGIAYGVQYFTSGDGSLLLYAPIALAVFGVLLKLVTVSTPEPAQPQADFGGGPLPQRDSKLKRFVLG